MDNNSAKIFKYIGVDYGTKRTGIAVSDDTGVLAFPLITLATSAHLAADIVALVRDHKAHAVVLGESRDFSGAPNPVMQHIVALATELKGQGVVVEMEQELFSSALSARQFAPEEKSRKANPSQEKLDASAAAIILQSYLDRNKPRADVE
jgi:putative Holliday junction resolvase